MATRCFKAARLVKVNLELGSCVAVADDDRRTELT
jgi:hypothetical protein